MDDKEQYPAALADLKKAVKELVFMHHVKFSSDLTEALAWPTTEIVLCTLKVDDLDSNGLLRSFVVSTRRGVKVEVSCWTRRTPRTLYTPLRTIPCLHCRNEDAFSQQHSQHK